MHVWKLRVSTLSCVQLWMLELMMHFKAKIRTIKKRLEDRHLKKLWYESIYGFFLMAKINAF